MPSADEAGHWRCGQQTSGQIHSLLCLLLQHTVCSRGLYDLTARVGKPFLSAKDLQSGVDRMHQLTMPPRAQTRGHQQPCKTKACFRAAPNLTQCNY